MILMTKFMLFFAVCICICKDVYNIPVDVAELLILTFCSKKTPFDHNRRRCRGYHHWLMEYHPQFKAFFVFTLLEINVFRFQYFCFVLIPLSQSYQRCQMHGDTYRNVNLKSFVPLFLGHL